MALVEPQTQLSIQGSSSIVSGSTSEEREAVWAIWLSMVTPRKSCSPPSLLLPFRFPVFEKFFQSCISQRVFKQRLEYAVRHRADMTAG